MITPWRVVVLALAGSVPWSATSSSARPTPAASGGERAGRQVLAGGAGPGARPVLRPGAPEPRRVRLECPDDLVVECDGTGNVAERAAWREAFSASANGGCAPVEVGFEVRPVSRAFEDFEDLSAFTLNGVTGLIGNPVFDGDRWVLRLTDGFSQSGSAFLTEPLDLGADGSFSAYFTFRISGSAGSSDSDGVGADGLVFVVQTVSDSVGAPGGGLGYQGIAPSLGIEMDTWDNGAGDRFNGNHVGIDLNGDIASVEHVGLARRLNDGATWHAWVEHDGSTGVLEVRVQPGPGRPDLPLLTRVVDLPALLGSTTAFVGFTSGTGSGSGLHDVLSFYFDDGFAPIPCAGTGVETVVATATDACGDVESCTRSVVVEDTTPPVPWVGSLPGCFASGAEAEAAALLATDVEEACSGLLELTASATGTCDAEVRVRAVDRCGNASSVDVPVRIDATPPTLECPGEILVAATSFDGALASPAVVASDGCDAVPVVVNDRTAGGSEATDLYPCGATPVTFTATDACAHEAACTVVVRVAPPAAATPVGAMLRVSRSATGQAELEWSAAGPRPELARWAVLRGGLGAAPVAKAASGLEVAWWTDPDPAPAGPEPRLSLVLYDVRTELCDGGLSVD